MSGARHTQSLHRAKRKRSGRIPHSSVPSSRRRTMCGAFSCICWIPLFVLLHGLGAPASDNSSAQNQLPNMPHDRDYTDSLFLHLRASLLSHSQPVRPYTLLTNMEEYHNMPKPRNVLPSRLLRLLGPSFEPFWMSVEKPRKVSDGKIVFPRGKLPNRSGGSKEKTDQAPPAELREAAADQHQELEREAARLDLSSLPPHVSGPVRSWLVRSATCELSFRWRDLGPAFWPRWLRQTDCEVAEPGAGCSFPGGMECARARTARLKILAWHCLELRADGVEGSRKIRSGQNISRTDAETGTSEGMKSCMWRKVSYPVVTACACSCK